MLKINNKSIDGSLTKIHFHDQLNISLQFFDIFRERKREKLSKKTKIRNVRKYIKLTWRDRGWNNSSPPFFVTPRVASLLHGIAEIRKKFIAIHEMEGDEMARDTILHLPVLFYPRTLRVSAFQLITHEELSFFHLDSLLSFHSRSPLYYYYYYYFTCLDASIFSLSLYSLLLPSFFLEREKERIFPYSYYFYLRIPGIGRYLSIMYHDIGSKFSTANVHS